VKLVALIYCIGQVPLRAGRVALATILWHADFRAYAELGRSITGSAYIATWEPGQMAAPANPVAAIGTGWRWGRIEHALLTGSLSWRDAEWIADKWRDGVPV
jgi:hypothetical protein